MQILKYIDTKHNKAGVTLLINKVDFKGKKNYSG